MEPLESANRATERTENSNNNGYAPKITVLGIGNLLMKDDGIGVHAVQRLSGIIQRNNVTIVDGGTDPDIISLVGENSDKLIIVDAAEAGEKPGTVYRFTLDDLQANTSMPVSLHEIGVAESLQLLTLLNIQPKSVTIIGVEPKAIDSGLELSREVEEKIPRIIELIIEEIEKTNISTEGAR